MKRATVIIPNYNGLKFLPACLDSLKSQSRDDFEIVIVDNGSTDGSIEWIKDNGYEIIEVGFNSGFAGAVNRGIRYAYTEYVILLNNDTTVDPQYVDMLIKAGDRSRKIFSISPMMIQSNNRHLIDDAGDGLCMLGWGYQRGVGEPIEDYDISCDIFSACGGGALYRRDVFDKIGLFDEDFFAYLEDIDIGYRAKLAGYHNRYEPRAKVYHIGSATSGSKYNSFKVKLASRNFIYLHHKNLATWQKICNFLPLLIGTILKAAFFAKKGFLKDYIEGLSEGISERNKIKKSDINTWRALSIQWELITGTFEYMKHFIKRRYKI